MLIRLRGLAKTGQFFVQVAGFVLFVGVGSLFYLDEIKRRQFRIGASSIFNRWILRRFHIRYRILGAEHLPAESSPILIVSNHVSDLDAMILSAVCPAVFITSKEVGEAHFLGLLSRIAGSLFVERRKFFTLPSELNELNDILREGFSVVLFPEGTSTNGEGILPFKSALFRAAIGAQVPILPVCIQYQSINGKPVTRRNRDEVFYYGDMRFLSHLRRLCQVQSIEAKIWFQKPISAETQEGRKELSRRAHASITEVFHPVR